LPIKKGQPTLAANQQQNPYSATTNTLEASPDQAVERAVSSLVIALVKNKLPNAVPYIVGFHLIDYNDESNKGLGFLVLKLGQYVGYIPVIFDKGEIRGLDVMHVKELNLFLPATDDWLKFFTANAQVLAGEPVDKTISQTYPVPDITRAAITPLKQASFKANKLYNEIIAREYDKYKNYYSNIDYGKDLFGQFRQAYKKFAQSIKLISKIFTKEAGLTNLPKPYKLSNAPNLIDLIYEKDEMLALDLANEILSNPLTKYYADKFYKNSRAWKFLKESIRKGDPSGLLFAQGAHVNPNNKIPASMPLREELDEEEEEEKPVRKIRRRRKGK